MYQYLGAGMFIPAKILYGHNNAISFEIAYTVLHIIDYVIGEQVILIL